MRRTGGTDSGLPSNCFSSGAMRRRQKDAIAGGGAYIAGGGAITERQAEFARPGSL